MERLFLNSLIPFVILLTSACVHISFPGRSFGQEVQPAPTADSAAEFSADAIEFFEKQVRPLLVAKCYECHSGEEDKGGLRLDSRKALLTGGDSGPAVAPTLPDQSRLIEAIRYKNLNLQMPPDGKLPDDSIAILTKWVEMGVPAPSSDVSAPSKPLTGMSIEDGKRFWSFLPITAPAIPANQDSHWPSNPIDAFLLAELETKGLRPSPAADKRTLIRRVTLDLTGLPPTREAISAFLADDSPNAYAKLVDRLLHSPQYGVRWGRHWLDVARYADSNGLDENLAFGNAWRYRDYVVDSFNANKPYNQFVMEQLAGDLLPASNRETMTATGFLVLGAKVLAEPDREKVYMDTIDEQIDTLGKAFLGMTLGCVRCHDHKFDPIKQNDYYGLAAIFKSTQTFAPTNTGAIKHWQENSFALPSDLEQLKKIDAEIAAKNAAAAKYKSDAMAAIRDRARRDAAKYMAAAARLASTATLGEVAMVAEPIGLHPRVLHHCRLHIAYHPDDALFAKWYELAPALPGGSTKLAVDGCETDPNKGDETPANSLDAIQQIEQHYQKLFDDAQMAWEQAQKADPKTKSLADPSLELARNALLDPEGLLAVPPQPEFAFDAATLAEYDRLMEDARLLESSAPDEDAAMGVKDGRILTSIPIHIRGSHRNLGEPIRRELPQVMKSSPLPTLFARNQSGRLELAQWITSTQHPLTARVFVNRLWRWHFGRGLVASTENFGLLGDRPTHPGLLDWLAYTFMENGWSVKELQRLILLSSAYQMASANADSMAISTDPENLLLWRFPILRLEAEQIRDSILAVSGRLDSHLGGKTVPLRNRQFVFNHTSKDHTKYDSLRRAVYLPVIRNNLYTFFEQFDFPDPTMPTGNRNATVVAPQSLLMMNDDLVLDSADAFAKQVMASSTETSQRIDWAYETAVGRLPTESERAQVASFVEHLANESAVGDGDRRAVAWSLVCHSLMASNEFIYVR